MFVHIYSVTKIAVIFSKQGMNCLSKTPAYEILEKVKGLSLPLYLGFFWLDGYELPSAICDK